jgi:hypothetical protein
MSWLKSMNRGIKAKGIGVVKKGLNKTLPTVQAVVWYCRIQN